LKGQVGRFFVISLLLPFMANAQSAMPPSAKAVPTVFDDSNFFGTLDSISPISCDSVKRRPDDKFDLMPCHEPVIYEEEVPEEEVTKDSQKRPAPKSREDIEELFGSPEEDEVVLAKEDAPRPVQAFYAALSIGDTELAKDYAKKVARYFEDLRQTNDQFTRVLGEEMNKPRVHDLDAFVEKALSNEQLDVPESLRQELLSLVAQENEMSLAPSPLEERTLREQYRQKFLTMGLPRSQSGIVEVIGLVDVQDPEAVRATGDLLIAVGDYNKSSAASKRKVAAKLYYLGQPSAEELHRFRNAFNSTIPLHRAGALGDSLKSKSYFTTAFMLLDKQYLHLEEQPKPALYTEELIRHFHGDESTQASISPDSKQPHDQRGSAL
jgi:hypothetical protein